MAIKINDKLNNRILVIDYENQQLTITGDFSSSSFSTYWVSDKFNLHQPIAIFVTYESALRFCSNRNKKLHTDVFVVTKRTIFV